MNLDYNYTLLMLVVMRMSGCVMFNPILGRYSIPAVVRVGLTLMLSVFSYQAIPVKELEVSSFLVLFVLLLQQLLIGFAVGYIIQLFMASILVSGEAMDMQIGLSMSKIYDPQSNISMPLTASLINTMFILIFFATNGHLTMVQIFTQLCALVPYQGLTFHQGMFGELASLFSLILIYAVKMSFPMMAAELISEIGVGLIMRAVPQIDVFVVSIQLKVLIGFVVILIMVPSLSIFLERLMTLMFDQINHVFQALT